MGDDQPATQQDVRDVRAEIAGLRGEMRQLAAHMSTLARVEERQSDDRQAISVLQSTISDLSHRFAQMEVAHGRADERVASNTVARQNIERAVLPALGAAVMYLLQALGVLPD